MCEMKLLIHSQTSTAQPKTVHSALYYARDYLSMLELKLIRLSKWATYVEMRWFDRSFKLHYFSLIKTIMLPLTHCGLVTEYGVLDPAQHGIR